MGFEDERVEGAYDTPGWMAPEILNQDAFSPIRADRWSCDKVLLYFLEERRTEGGELERFANEMMNDNLLHRPSLVDWLEGVDVTLCDDNSEDKNAVDDKESIRDKEASGGFENSSKRRKIDVGLKEGGHREPPGVLRAS